MALAKHVRGKVKSDGKIWYVFIDEIQYSRKVLRPGVDLSRVAPEDIETCYVTFYDVLNELRLMPNVEVYVTGSNSRLLSKDVATNFRDRGFEVRVFPLSFAECCAALPGEKGEILEDYLAWGGMPQAVLEKDVAVRERYLKDLFDKVYLKDIRERNKLRDDYALEGVVDVVSSSIGSLTNPHKLVNTLKSVLNVDTTDVTMKRYLEYLEDSFLFSKALRYDVRGRAYLDLLFVLCTMKYFFSLMYCVVFGKNLQYAIFTHQLSSLIAIFTPIVLWGDSPLRSNGGTVPCGLYALSGITARKRSGAGGDRILASFHGDGRTRRKGGWRRESRCGWRFRLRSAPSVQAGRARR